jgi:hypothetical protein
MKMCVPPSVQVLCHSQTGPPDSVLVAAQNAHADAVRVELIHQRENTWLVPKPMIVAPNAHASKKSCSIFQGK